MSGNCGSCRHWTERTDFLSAVEGAAAWNDEPSPADELDKQFRECSAVPAGKIEVSTDPVPLALTLDGSDYWSALYTRAEFSCQLFEEKAL